MRLLISSCLFLLVASTAIAKEPTRRGYENNISPYPYAFALVKDPHPVRYGTRSERFEVRNGDCGGSDCSAPRYRSEIALKASRTKARFGKDIWYGWSFYNASIPSFNARNNLFINVGQWKMGGPTNPIIKFHQLGQGDNTFARCSSKICSKFGGRSSDDVFVSLDDLKNAPGVKSTSANNWLNVCRLFGMSSNLNKWVDIVINTNFSMRGDGYQNIWINGEKKCAYLGRLAVTENSTWYRGPNHRRGIFVAHTSRWTKNYGSKPFPTFVAYYDEFRVGKSREEVDIRMIEARNGKAVD